MAIREGRWDCPSCGSKAIYGRHVDCPGCGKPRPAGIRFYLTDDAPAITDAARLAEARAGADWVCAQCRASNRATLASCGGCGAPRAADSATHPVIAYGPGQAPRSGDVPARAARASIPPASAGKSYILHAIAVVFLALFGMIGWVAVSSSRAEQARSEESRRLWAPRPLEPAAVVGMRWERRMVVAHRQLVPGAGAVVPESAQVLAVEQRLAGHRQVVDHYRISTRQVPRTIQHLVGYETRTRRVAEEVQSGSTTYVCGQTDLGNGYFADRMCSEPTYTTRYRSERYQHPLYRNETRMVTVTDSTPVYRQEPVYTPWYSWNRAVWSDSMFVARGDTTPPAWPVAESGPARRVNERGASYYLTLRRPGSASTWEAEVDSAQWARLRVGQPVAIRTRPYGGVELLPADSLPACVQYRAGQASIRPDSLGCSPSPRDAARADSAAGSTVHREG